MQYEGASGRRVAGARRRRVAGARGRRVAGAIRFLGYASYLHLECARVLHETLLVPVLIYGSETMLWKEKDRS